MCNKRTALEFDAQVGANIKAIRRLKRISQNKLAKKCSITFQQIQKYESGKNRISLSRLKQIAGALEEPMMKLLNEKACNDPLVHLNDTECDILNATRAMSPEKQKVVWDIVKVLS